MNYVNLINSYKSQGTIYVSANSGIIPKEDVLELKSLCDRVPKEYVEIGDAGEENHLHVGRFMTDSLIPEMVNPEFANPLIKILSKDKILDLISRIIEIKKLDICYRRIQYNEIKKNCFVGYHLDTDSNPDYLAACVIQLGSNFQGGKYRVYQKQKKDVFFDYQSDFGGLIISDCKYAHEVTKVTSGTRGSLVFFVSNYKGKNKRKF